MYSDSWPYDESGKITQFALLYHSITWLGTSFPLMTQICPQFIIRPISSGGQDSPQTLYSFVMKDQPPLPHRCSTWRVLANTWRMDMKKLRAMREVRGSNKQEHPAPLPGTWGIWGRTWSQEGKDSRYISGKSMDFSIELKQSFSAPSSSIYTHSKT